MESSTRSNLGCQTLKDLPKTILTPSKKANFRDLKHPCEIQVKIGGSQLMGCFPPISVGQHRWTSPVVFVMEKPSHPELGQCSKRLRALFALAFWRPRAKWIFFAKVSFWCRDMCREEVVKLLRYHVVFFLVKLIHILWGVLFCVWKSQWTYMNIGERNGKKGAAFCSTIFKPKFTMQSKPHGCSLRFFCQVLTRKRSEEWELRLQKRSNSHALMEQVAKSYNIKILQQEPWSQKQRVIDRPDDGCNMISWFADSAGLLVCLWS